MLLELLESMLSLSLMQGKSIPPFSSLGLLMHNSPDWDIIALSRRPLDFPSRAVHHGADLLSKDDIEKKLSHSGMYPF